MKIYILYKIQISCLQQEIDLQGRIRDEMIIEFNNDLTDENTKKKIESKLAHNEEKVQALRKFLSSTKTN